MAILTNIDFNNSRFITTSGDIAQPSINIYRGSTYTLSANVYDSFDTFLPVNLSANNDFQFYLGSTFGLSASPVVSSTNFNNNLSSGLLSVTFDTSVSALALDISANFSKEYQMNIWCRDGVKNVLIVQNPITINNIAVEI